MQRRIELPDEFIFASGAVARTPGELGILLRRPENLDDGWTRLQDGDVVQWLEQRGYSQLARKIEALQLGSEISQEKLVQVCHLLQGANQSTAASTQAAHVFASGEASQTRGRGKPFVDVQISTGRSILEVQREAIGRFERDSSSRRIEAASIEAKLKTEQAEIAAQSASRRRHVQDRRVTVQRAAATAQSAMNEAGVQYIERNAAARPQELVVDEAVSRATNASNAITSATGELGALRERIGQQTREAPARAVLLGGLLMAGLAYMLGQRSLPSLQGACPAGLCERTEYDLYLFLTLSFLSVGLVAWLCVRWITGQRPRFAAIVGLLAGGAGVYFFLPAPAGAPEMAFSAGMALGGIAWILGVAVTRWMAIRQAPLTSHVSFVAPLALVAGAFAYSWSLVPEPTAVPREQWAIKAPDGLLSVRVSPDGRFVASTGMDGRVRLTDLASGKLVRSLKGHPKPATGLEFSADGKLLASRGSDWKVRLWDVSSGKQTRVLEGPGFGRMAFTADGKWIAVAGWGRNVQLWNTASGERGQTLRHSESAPSVYAASKAPRLLTMVWLGGATLRVWEVPTGKKVQEIKTDKEEGFTGIAAISPDGRLVASAGRGGMVRVWNVSDARELWSSKKNSRYASSREVQFSPDGLTLAALSNGRVRLWDAETGRHILYLRHHKGSQMDFAPDGKRLVLVDWFSRIQLLKIR